MGIFYKYQGTGNDFIMIDNRDDVFQNKTTELIKLLCDRRFGVGADGLILLEKSEVADFKMVYFNADGNQGTMCGNGGRCVVAFAKYLDVISDRTIFEAVDGKHYATIEGDVVKLQMNDVEEITCNDNSVFLNTGSPHHVQFEEDLSVMDVVAIGRKIRNEVYGTAGSNVNFVKKINDSLFKMRTYERGVEDETLACGTGATAVAIAMHNLKKTALNKLVLQVEGGELEVSFKVVGKKYTEVFLKGKAVQVFKGEIKW